MRKETWPEIMDSPVTYWRSRNNSMCKVLRIVSGVN